MQSLYEFHSWNHLDLKYTLFLHSLFTSWSCSGNIGKVPHLSAANSSKEPNFNHTYLRLFFSASSWSFFIPFPTNRTYICVSPPQMGQLGFFHIYNLLPPLYTVENQRDSIDMVGKEGEWRKKKKSPEINTLPWPGFEPMDSVSRADRSIR